MNDLTDPHVLDFPEDRQQSPAMLLAMHASDINQQVATAKRFPRALGKVTQTIAAYACNDDDTAQECIYALKRGGKEVIGPSVRFAEIVASAWGNSIFAARVAEEGETFITAQAVFHDLETNNRFSFEVPRRIVDRDGRRFNVDMIGVTANAAMSIALRNAILKGIPKAAWGGAYAKCLAMIQGSFETIERRRANALDAFKKLGVSQDLVLGLLEKQDVRDIEPGDMVILRGTLQAIRDGDTSVRQVFGAINVQQAAGDAAKGKKAPVSEHLANGKKNAAEASGKSEAGKATGKATSKGGSKAAKSQAAGESAGFEGGKPSDGDQGGQDAGDASGGSDVPADGENASGEAAGGESEADSGEASFQESGEDEGAAEAGAETTVEEVEEVELDLSPYEAILGQQWAPTSKTVLENAAREFAACKSAADVAAVIKRRAPDFESETPPVENAFSSLSRIAQKRFASAAASKL